MRVCIPTWGGRVSPVFDVAKRVLLVDAEDGTEVSREETGIPDAQPARRVGRLAELGVNMLICGAISAPLEAMLLSAGVHVVAHACGPVEEVLRAFLAGRLADGAFLMPGCCGQRRRARSCHRGGRSRLKAQGDVA